MDSLDGNWRIKMSNIHTTTGPGCLTLMFILFLALKLTGVITWSWWWVCSPLIASAGIIVSLLAILAVVAIVHKKQTGKWLP